MSKIVFMSIFILCSCSVPTEKDEQYSFVLNYNPAPTPNNKDTPFEIEANSEGTVNCNFFDKKTHQYIKSVVKRTPALKIIIDSIYKQINPSNSKLFVKQIVPTPMPVGGEYYSLSVTKEKIKFSIPIEERVLPIEIRTYAASVKGQILNLKQYCKSNSL